MGKAKPILSKEILQIRALYDELKKARTVLTWDEFADEIKKDRTYISRVMNGHEPLTEQIKDAIEKRFGTTKNVPRGTNEFALHETHTLSEKDLYILNLRDRIQDHKDIIRETIKASNEALIKLAAEMMDKFMANQQEIINLSSSIKEDVRSVLKNQVKGVKIVKPEVPLQIKEDRTVPLKKDEAGTQSSHGGAHK